MLAAGDVDFVDPGETYYAFGYTVHYAVNRPLYSYGPGDDGQPRPDLAAGAPQCRPTRRRSPSTSSPGIRYAPPVDREVTSKDVKYAFERAFSSHVPSPYASLYFSDIVGAPDQAGRDRGHPGDPDARRPHDRLQALQALRALQLTRRWPCRSPTPVPEEYAQKFDAKTPSTYDQHVAFTGPYMYNNDGSGKLIGHQPGKAIELVRNPNWDAKTDYRPAYLDSITIQEGNRDAVSAARRVLGRPAPRPGRPARAGAGDQAGAAAQQAARSPSSPAAATA